MPTLASAPIQQAAPLANNPFDSAKAMAQQILGAPDSKLAFEQMLASNPNFKEGWDLMLKYGNGDPHAAFINRSAEMGNQMFADQIKRGLGLG